MRYLSGSQSSRVKIWIWLTRHVYGYTCTGKIHQYTLGSSVVEIRCDLANISRRHPPYPPGSRTVAIDGVLVNAVRTQSTIGQEEALRA